MKKQLFFTSVGILVFTYFSLLPSIGIASEPYDFTSEVINSFKLCSIAQDRIKNISSESLVEQIKSIIVYNNEIRVAAGCLEPYLNSNNELINKNAKYYHFIYLAVVKNNEDLLSYIESILNNPNEYSSKEGTMIRKYSEVLAANEELWRLLLQTTAMLTHTLVDQKRTEGGKLCCLSITSQERKNLVLQIEQAFGPQVKGGPRGGQFPLEGSASLLWYFLNQGWKPSDWK